MGGSDECIVFHHQVRNTEMNGEGGVQGYATSYPYTDTSAVSGDQQAIAFVPNGDDPSTYKWYTYVNLWRNIADIPIENDHLAMLDERTTVKPDDYITRDLFGDGYDVVQYGLNDRHAESTHKWYYFPRMTKNEGI